MIGSKGITGGLRRNQILEAVEPLCGAPNFRASTQRAKALIDLTRGGSRAAFLYSRLR
jgi:hypothetical protein